MSNCKAKPITKFRAHETLKAIIRVFFMLVDGGCGTWLGNPDGSKDPKIEPTTPTPSPIIPPSESSVNLTFQGIKPLQLLSTLQVVGKNGTSIGTIVMEQAYIVLGGIEFQSADNEQENDGEIDFAGPYIVDVLNDSVSPQPQPKNLAEGLYNEIQLKMEKLEEEQAATLGASVADLINRSIFIKGQYIDSIGTKKAFTMSFSLDEEFNLVKGGAGINLLGGLEQQVVIAFNLQSWFDFSNMEKNQDALDFSDITAADIVLGEDSDATEKSLHEMIKENIKGSSEFGKDEDKDGDLSNESDALSE